MSATKSKVAKTAARLRKAEEDVVAAKEAHRQAFRQALVGLCNEYGFYLEACGTEGASIDLVEVRAGQQLSLEDVPS